MTLVDGPKGGERLARSVAVSTSTQLAARGVDLVVNGVVALAIIRHLGPRGYGDFVVVVTVAGVAGLLADLGLPKLAVREVVRNRAMAGRIIGSTTLVRLGLSLVAAGVAQLMLSVLDVSGEVRLATLFASSMAVAEALLSVVVIFHATLRQQYEAFIRLAANMVKLLLVALLVGTDAGLAPIVAATSATLLVASALGWILAPRRFGLRPAWDWTIARGLLREAVAVGPALLIGVLYLKIGAVLVALLGTRVDVGVFGSAYQPIEYLFLASAVVVQVLYSVLARWEPGSARFDETYQRGTELLLLLVVPVAAVVAGSAGPLTRLAYDERFADAAVPLAILAVALIGMTVNVWQGMALLAAHRAGANLACLMTALVVNIALGGALIPWLGPAGAAWATMLSTAVLVVLSTRAVASSAGAVLVPHRLALIAVAGGSLVVTMSVVSLIGGNGVVAVAIGGAAYVLVVVRSGLVGLEGLRATFADQAVPPAALPARAVVLRSGS